MANLKASFAVVGVVEKYSLFVDLLQNLLDPKGRLGDFWAAQKAKRENESKLSTGGVLRALEALDRPFVATFNQSLRHEWAIYAAGRDIAEAHAARLGLKG